MIKRVLAVLMALVALCAFAVAEETAEDWVKKGDELFAEGSLEEADQAWDEALRLYDESIGQNPQDVNTLIERAKLLDRMTHSKSEPDEIRNTSNKTIDAINKVIEIDPNSSEAWYQKGRSLYHLGLTGYPIQERSKFFADAVEAFDSAIEIDPTNVYALKQKGFILAQWGQLEEWMGKHEEALDKWEESLNAYDKAIEIGFPGYDLDHQSVGNDSISVAVFYADAWNGKGQALYKLGQYNESLQAYDKAIDPDYMPGVPLISKGIVLTELGMYDEAIDAFDEAFELGSWRSEALRRKGDVLLMLGKNEEALEAFNHSIVLSQFWAIPWEGKGVALDKLGRHEEASKAYGEALARYNESVERNPRDVKEWTDKGSFLNRISKYGEALKAFDKAIEIYPEFSPAWQGKSDALKALGNNTEAEVAFTKARELGYTA